jgi:hypothetical protein
VIVRKTETERDGKDTERDKHTQEQRLKEIDPKRQIETKKQ